MEAAEETGGAGGHNTGRKLVPWSSWAEWRFIRDAIFSPYPDHDAALRRIAAWRSRGCLPTPVEVTASLFEIRLRDPFFRDGVADKLESDEMLALLYMMAIVRLVNGFLESPHKKTRHSLSDLAETVGIPRILVDIRHESSHRDMPSLRLLHLAAIKAFDWLKCNYWDSQTKAIPDARLELSTVLHGIAQNLKGKDTENAKPGSKRKRACLPAESPTMKNLCSLVLWIVTSIKELKDSGRIGLVHEIGVLSSDKNAVPRFCLAKLLQKLLSLSVIGERCIADAALLLIEMSGNNNVKEKLRKLPLLSLQKSPKDRNLNESRVTINGQESVESATEKLELFKLQLRKPDNARLAENGTEGTISTSLPEKRNRWSIAKSWTPCPLGMIPCSYSSTAVLPSLDVIDHELKDVAAEHGNFEHGSDTEMFDSHPQKQLDNEGIQEISISPPEDDISDMPEVTSPLKGTLLVGGVWKKVTEEELLSIKSRMKILF
ncbi:unnamed protein product [Alopecurus aequalis]